MIAGRAEKPLKRPLYAVSGATGGNVLPGHRRLDLDEEG